MDLKAIGSRVKLRRKELGMTQDELAARTNLSQAAIAKIERGGGTRYIPEIAKALVVNTSWLVYGEDEATRRAGYWPFNAARLSDFESLPSAKRDELDVRLADFIAGALGTKSTT